MGASRLGGRCGACAAGSLSGVAVYHLPGCKDCEKIAPGNLVEYSEAPAGKTLHQGCPK